MTMLVMVRAALALFGETVRTLRHARGWSQSELAERANLHINFVGRLERGEIVSPELVSVLKLAVGLKVPPASLLACFTPDVMRRLRPALRRETRNPHAPFAQKGRQRP